MTHFLAELTEVSKQSIEAMKKAAQRARLDHSASELIRHMIMTTEKSANIAKEDAIESVVAEWLEAWYLKRDEWPEIAAEMESLTAACYDYCNDRSDANDQAVRATWYRLKEVHDNEKRTLEDQMAWRSICTYGWWADVSPPPDGYRDHDAERPREPFWTKACPPECLGES